MPKANAQRLTILAELRLAAGLTLSDMAHRCGLRGNQSHQSAGAWERGEMIPNDGRRRTHFLGYLWDDLGLRRDPAQFEKVWDILVEEWQWEPISDREWAGLTNRPRSKAETTPAPALTVGSPAPFHAPALVGHFVGRETTLTQLTTLLTAPSGARAVALVGMGGVGKSTLAIHAAHALREHFVDGVLWANLATAHPLQVLQVWALALGYDFSGITDLESRAAAVRGVLANRCCLMVLDDVRSAEVVRPLLPGTASCSILMTTRDHDIATVLNLQPFALGELPIAAGRQLLSEILGEARVRAEAEAAEHICRLVEGYPLALEIIAKLLVRNRWQTLAATEARLRDATSRLDQLKLKDLSVRASFAVSWDALTAELQHSFALLGLFAGNDFALPAIAAIAAQPPEIMAEQLATLVALSLLNPEATDRFRQHPLLADYAREQLQEPAVAAAQMAEYYLTFVRDHQSQAKLLEADFENIMTAMQATYQHQHWLIVQAFADTLAQPWLRHARYSAARHGYQWAITATQHTQDEQALALYFVRWAMVCTDQGDAAEAETHLLQALEFATRHQQPAVLADAQIHLARIYYERGEYEAAEQLITDCQTIRTTLNDQVGLAKAYHTRAILYYRQGSYTQAQQLCQAALTLQEEEEDHLGLLLSLRLLTDLAMAQKDLKQAQALGKQFIELATQFGYQSELAEAYYSMATVHRLLNELNKAWDYASAAARIFHTIGNRAFLSYVSYEQSRIKRLAGDEQAAIELGHHSLTLMTANADDYNRVYCLMHLGDLYQQSNARTTAYQYWEEAKTLALHLHHPLMTQIDERLNAA